MDFLWPLIGGAFGAAFVNSAFAFYKLRIDADLEHVRWQRDQRRIDYGKYLEALTDHMAMLGLVGLGARGGQEATDELLASQDTFHKAGTQLALTTPNELLACTTRVKEATDDVVRSLVAQVAARKNGSTDPGWESAMGSLTRATADFMILARHDIGMLDDNQSKTRAALEKGLRANRETPMHL